MAAEEYQFEGWVAHDKSAADGKMKWEGFTPKRWEETDIDIKVTHCGMCGTDLHTLRSGWYSAPYPLIVGHEIVGEVVRVGSKALGGHKVGDRVGVGCQTDCCLSLPKPACGFCEEGQENYCADAKFTYPRTHHNGDKAWGGYATYHRCPGRFAVPIPEAVPSAQAATMMCAGATMFAPLKHNDVGPGKAVGIIGVGGLGHYGVMWAKAMGASKVVAISRRESKRDEAIQLGADEYIAVADEADWVKKHRRTLDVIVSTIASSQVSMPDYLELLKPRGTLVQVGMPEDGPFKIPSGSIVSSGRKFAGSCIASVGEIKEMLQLAADKNVKGWVEERPMKDANATVLDMEAGKARYRYCLVNEKSELKL